MLGKSFFVPKIFPAEGHMDFLKVHGQDDLDSFPSGLWGIKEPETHCEESARQNGAFHSAIGKGAL